MRHGCNSITGGIKIGILPALVAMTAASARAEVPRGEPPVADGERLDTAASATFEGVGAAVLPGLVVHGTGLWVAGDRGTAYNLMRAEGAALSVLVVAGGLLGATGASRRISAQAIPLFVVSSGVFFQSWFADIYGSAGGGRRGAEPRLELPPLALELSAVYVRDVLFDYGPMTRLAATWQLGPLGLAPEALISATENNQRLIGRASVQLWGPAARRRSGDGSMVELATAVRWHRFGDDDFSTIGVEGVIGGRLDGARLGPSLAGSFADLELGFGLEATRYMTTRDVDTNDALLVRFAYGLYLGGPSSRIRGEASVFYDHRRDELAGGISPGDGLAGGFLGYFGAALDLDVSERIGILSSIEFGSALVVALGARVRFGELNE